MLLHLCEWLERLPFIVAISNSMVLSAIMEVAHYSGFFLLVGSIAILDLRVLGLAARRATPATLAAQLFPWMCAGLVSAFLSGFLMFAGQASEYAQAKSFGVKMLVLLGALVAGIIVQRHVSRSDNSRSPAGWIKLLALLSLALWIGAILAGVEVPAQSGLG